MAKRLHAGWMVITKAGKKGRKFRGKVWAERWAEKTEGRVVELFYEG